MTCGHVRQGVHGKDLPCAHPGCPEGFDGPVYRVPVMSKPSPWASWREPEAYLTAIRSTFEVEEYRRIAYCSGGETAWFWKLWRQESDSRHSPRKVSGSKPQTQQEVGMNIGDAVTVVDVSDCYNEALLKAHANGDVLKVKGITVGGFVEVESIPGARFFRSRFKVVEQPEKFLYLEVGEPACEAEDNIDAFTGGTQLEVYKLVRTATVKSSNTLV